ncbi:hypothetical protein LCGC14_2585420, partial [marine sediment metagenome]
MKQRVKVIGITGGIASGKSTVAKMLRSLGASVINADNICHQLINTEEIKNKISIDSKRLPLYNYRHEGFKFIAKYRNALRNQDSPIYDFDIRTDEQEGLNFLIEKRIINVQDGKVVLLSEDRLNNSYLSLG